MREADAGFTEALCWGKGEGTYRKRHSPELSDVRGVLAFLVSRFVFGDADPTVRKVLLALVVT